MEFKSYFIYLWGIQEQNYKYRNKNSEKIATWTLVWIFAYNRDLKPKRLRNTVLENESRTGEGGRERESWVVYIMLSNPDENLAWQNTERRKSKKKKDKIPTSLKLIDILITNCLKKIVLLNMIFSGLQNGNINQFCKLIMFF